MQQHSKAHLLILLVILILTQIMRYTFNSRIIGDDSLIRTKIIIKDYPRSCFYTGWSDGVIDGAVAGLFPARTRVGVKLPHCRQYRLGSILEVTSSHVGLFANETQSLKVLKDPDIFYQGQSRLSLFLNFRQATFDYLVRNLGSPEGEVMFSLLVGGTNHLPDNLKRQLNILGLNHLLAVSGLHLTIMAGFIWSVLRRVKLVSTPTRLLFFSSLILAYLGLSLWRVSAVRAGIMVLMLFWSREVFHRAYRSWWGVLTALGLLLILDPSVIQEISFQFSFLATLVIILMVSQDTLGLTTPTAWETVNRHLFRSVTMQTKPSWLSQARHYLIDSLKLSLVVNLVLLPLVIYYFQAFSLWSFISTSLFLWLIPVLFLFGLVMLLAWPLTLLGHLGWLLTQALGLVVAEPIKLMLWLFSQLASNPQLYIQDLSLDRHQVAWWYLCLGCLLGILKVILVIKQTFKPDFYRGIHQ